MGKRCRYLLKLTLLNNKHNLSNNGSQNSFNKASIILSNVIKFSNLYQNERYNEGILLQMH